MLNRTQFKSNKAGELIPEVAKPIKNIARDSLPI